MFWTSKWTTKCNVVFTFSTCICIVWAWAVCLCQSILEDSEKSRWVLYIALSVGHSEENENKYPMSHGQSNVKLKAKISNFGKKKYTQKNNEYRLMSLWHCMLTIPYKYLFSWNTSITTNYNNSFGGHKPDNLLSEHNNTF